MDDDMLGQAIKETVRKRPASQTRLELFAYGGAVILAILGILAVG